MVEIGGVDASIAWLSVGLQIMSGRDSLLYPVPGFDPIQSFDLIG